jgi:hypothetical protein
MLEAKKMKLELSRKIRVHVLDVSMPILRSAVRNDLRVIAKLAMTEHEGSLAGRSGEAIREMLGMKSNSWKRVVDEGETAHRLWRDGQLTPRGRKCAENGVVLDHEDGPHRLWVIEAPEPIGMKIIHIEAWADIALKTVELGEEHKGRFVSRIRNEGYEHASIIDPHNRCRFKPPSWWVRWIKRDPVVQEHPNLSTEIDLLCTWEPGDSASGFAARGKLAGLDDKHIAFQGSIDVERSPAAEQMAAIVSSTLSTKLSGGQTWHDASKSLLTDVSSLNADAIERMKMDIHLGRVEDSRIGDWSDSVLRDIELRAKDEDAARGWIAALFWNRNDPIHRTVGQTNGLVGLIATESAFKGLNLNNEDAMADSLVKASNAPDGVRWLFEAARDMSLAIGQEESA